MERKCDDPQQNYKQKNNVKAYDDSRWGYRHQQSILLFLYVMIAYSVRSCLAVILVSMIDQYPNFTLDQPNMRDNNTNTSELHGLEEPAVTDYKVNGLANVMLFTPPYPKVQWSKQQQDFVLAAFFWGYFLMQIPGGNLAHRFGTRQVLTVSMIINSVMFLFGPWICYHGGWIGMAVSRILQGLAQGVIFPALHAFFGKWARLEERARLTSYAYSGVCLGPLVGLLVAGLASGSPIGWPGTLRLFGIFAAFGAAAVWYWLADTPDDHPRISHVEKHFIYEGLGEPDGTKQRPIPWKLVLSHRGIMAIIAAHIANAWFMGIIYVETPLFISNVLRVNVKSIGLLMSLPFLAMFLASFIYGWISDVLIIRGWLSVVGTRKLVNGFGLVCAAAGLCAMGLAPRNVLIVELLLIFINATKVAAHSGFFVNHIDISPNYAGVLMGLTNFLGNLAAAQVPLVTGIIVRDATSVEQWLTLFHVTAGILLSAAVLYQLFGTADRASWDQPTVSERTELSEQEKLMTTKDVTVVP